MCAFLAVDVLEGGESPGVEEEGTGAIEVLHLEG